MTSVANEIIEKFDSLPNDEKRFVITELLRRSDNRDAGEDDAGLSDSTLEELADELFLTLDAEEQSHG